MILVFNVGSSTLKYALFGAGSGDRSTARGTIEYGKGDRDAAAENLLQQLESDSDASKLTAVGHRLVHGGQHLCAPVVVDSAVRQSLRQLIPLAPDHLPLELRAVDAVSKRLPDLPQVACFDTAFHSRMPTRARLFGVPRKLSDAGVVRYGFHGLSYEYIVTMLQNAGRLPRRTIVAHLGNGASLTAILDGVSIDTTMGMTPTGGIVMSNRSGDLDPGAILFMMRELGFSASDVGKAVDKEGGLLGISGVSSDVRTLVSEAAKNTRAANAIDVFTYQAKKFIGAFTAALGGLDLLVFTGGIGEHSPQIRGRICEGLGFGGIDLDDARNQESAETISTEGSKVRVSVMKTDEEAMIATHVRRVLGQAAR